MSAVPWIRLAATRDLPTIAFFRAGVPLRRGSLSQAFSQPTGPGRLWISLSAIGLSHEFECIRKQGMIQFSPMSEDTPDEPNKATGKPVLLSGKATATSKSYGYMHVRLIHPSPATDPKLLKQAQKLALELKKKRGSAVGKNETGSYAKKSLSLFPVK